MRDAGGLNAREYHLIWGRCILGSYGALISTIEELLESSGFEDFMPDE